MIREVEPAKPSTKISSSDEIASIAAHRKLEPRQLTRMVSGDLDWVVMKALAKERKRRYQSVGDFAADISRFLNFEAVMARPPSVGYKLTKFVKRNQTAVAAGALIVLTLVGAFAATSYSLSIAMSESHAKTIALDSERKALQDVSLANDKTLAALRSLTDKFIAAQLARQTELSPDDQLFLTDIGRQYADFANLGSSTKANRAIRCEGLTRHALITKILGDRDLAKQELQDAADLWAEQTADFPNESAWQYESARCQIQLGEMEREDGNLALAESHLRTAATSLRSIPQTVSGQSEPVSLVQADVQHSLAAILYEMNRYREAISELSAAYLTCESELKIRPDNYAVIFRMASIQNSWGNQLQAVGDYRMALDHFDTAIKLTENIAEKFSGRPGSDYDLGLFHHNVGSLHRRMNKLDQAELHLDRAIEVLENLVDNYPVVSKYSGTLARTTHTRAVVESDRQRSESRPELQRTRSENRRAADQEFFRESIIPATGGGIAVWNRPIPGETGPANRGTRVLSTSN